MGTTHFELDCEVMHMVYIAFFQMRTYNLMLVCLPFYCGSRCLTCALSTTVAVFQGYWVISHIHADIDWCVCSETTQNIHTLLS